MKNSNQNRKVARPGSSLYRAFMNLDHVQRRRVALRILRNERLLEDLFDHFLIYEAMHKGGRSISWAAYRRTSKTTAS